MGVETILEDDRIAVHHHTTGSDITVFTFGARWGGAGHRPSGPSEGYGLQFLLKSGFDVVAMNPKSNRWYQDITDQDLAKIGERVKTAVRCGYGSSMGAYGAIMFAKPLKLDRVLAISPQFDPRTDASDRYPESLAVRFTHEWSKSDAVVFIAYDPKQHADNLHVEQIRPFVDFRPIALPYSGHPSGHYMNEVGLLKPLAAEAFQNGEPPAINLRTLRRKSGTYYLNLGRRAARTRHWKLALTLAQTAADLTPDAETIRFLDKAKERFERTQRRRRAA